MKYIFLILLFTATQVIGQSLYEQGYFINKKGERTECLIKNADWKYNPKSINYKLTEDGSVKIISKDSINELGAYNSFKYISAKVQIDRSSDDVGRLTSSNMPLWSNEKLLLKVLVEGKASLYYYEDEQVLRMFFSHGDSAIKQLVHRKFYKINEVVEVNWFRQQLSNIKCGTPDTRLLNNMKYSKAPLEGYFISYNSCEGSLSGSAVPSRPANFVSTTEQSKVYKSRQAPWVVKLTPGLNYSSFSLNGTTNGYTKIEESFKSTLNFRLGLEAEYYLPNNNNHWGLVVEPSYQGFYSNSPNAKINYSSIQLPIGIRHHSFFENGYQLFFDGFISPFTLDINSGISYGSNQKLDVSTSSFGFALGCGLENSKISGEIRYYPSVSLVNDYVTWSSSFERLSLIIGIKLNRPE
jgi:hypothetical protein